MVIVWDEAKFGSGFDEIDNQHKQLFERVNRLTASIEKNPHNKAEVANLVLFLEDYVIEHFAHEERLMGEHRCADYPLNKSEHQKFLKNFAELRSQFEKEGVTEAFARRLQQDLVEWIETHVAGVDTTLRDVAP